MIGPLIAAFGFALFSRASVMSSASVTGSYWETYFLAVAVLDLAWR